MQAWTYKKLGFPVPYLVVGRWGMTPFPSKAPLRFIVGAPIAVPSNPLGEKVSTPMLVSYLTTLLCQSYGIWCLKAAEPTPLCLTKAELQAQRVVKGHHNLLFAQLYGLSDDTHHVRIICSQRRRR